jgi:hypothetical protein
MATTVKRVVSANPKRVTAKKTAAKPASTAPATKASTAPEPAKRGPGRPRKVVEQAPAPAPKRGPGRPRKAAPTPVVTPVITRTSGNRKVAGMTYKELAALSGYAMGTEQFIAAVELLKGGEEKLAVSHRIAALLPTTTRNDTPKQISNLVSNVIRGLLAKGFTIDSHWVMTKPS